MEQARLVLVTGATGYIGGRLVPRLLAAGYRVRCLVRDARRLQGRPWSEQVEVVEGDATRPETLPAALAGVSAAYFFIHSLSDTANYRERDMAVGAQLQPGRQGCGRGAHHLPGRPGRSCCGPIHAPALASGDRRSPHARPACR